MSKSTTCGLVATLLVSCGGRSALEVGDLALDGVGGAGGAGGSPTVGGAGGAGGVEPSCAPPRAPTVLASSEQVPTVVAVHAGYVYWLAGTEVRRTSRCEGAATTLAETPMEAGQNLAVTNDGVFWQTAAAVRRVPHQGGSVTVLASGGEIWGLHVDATAAFFYVRPTTSPGGIFGVSVMGGSPSALWTSSVSPGYVGPLAGDADFLYHFGGGSSPSGPLRRVAKDGGAMLELTITAIPSDAVADDAVYATFMQSVNEIRRYDTSDGSTSVLATNQPSPRAVAADDAHVYWTTSSAEGEGRLLRQLKPPAVGDAEVLFDGLSDARGLHVGSDAIYWTDRNEGMVWWQAKP